ncbi:hypothetical protein [uncultured Aquimarina sp.]|uniref:hypothetical protein n=1 Tax=uncultured Aquimarina sp. TaxID=575652 RepID=UPI00263790EE|nr:hypothetical protein [uncultured Aquimarina sp.]
MKKILLVTLLISLLSCGNEKESFKWNFDSDSKYIYSFSQITNSENKMKKEEKSNKSFISGNGKMIINGKSKNLADLSFEEIKVKLKNDFSRDTISDTQPNSIIQGLQSNGTFQVTSPSNDFIRLLLPLPHKKLSIGDTCKVSLNVPFNINGSLINSKGFNTLTFSNYEDIEGHKCVVLNGEINVSKLDLPDSFEGNYKLTQIGKGKYYFDIEKGIYIKSKVKFELTTLADNEDLYMSSKSSHEYEINFLDKIDKSKEITKTKKALINEPVNSPYDIAKTVIEFLQRKDTIKYLNIAIPLDKQKKLFVDNIKYNPLENDTMAIYRELKRKYDDRVDNFLVRAGYILEIMEEDKGFDIEKATIDTIYYKHEKTKNYGGFGRTIIGNWADLTVEMNFNNQKYYFEIPQIIKVENQWYLYYPEYYLRDEKERKFVDKRVKELKQKSEEFWK